MATNTNLYDYARTRMSMEGGMGGSWDSRTFTDAEIAAWLRRKGYSPEQIASAHFEQYNGYARDYGSFDNMDPITKGFLTDHFGRGQEGSIHDYTRQYYLNNPSAIPPSPGPGWKWNGTNWQQGGSANQQNIPAPNNANVPLAGNPGTAVANQNNGSVTPSPGPSIDFSELINNLTSLDLPTWAGPYSAPLTSGQLDAMTGFENFLSQSPMAQTFNQLGQSGGGVAEAGELFSAGGPGLDAVNAFASGANTPAAPNTTNMNPALDLMGGAQDVLQNMPTFEQARGAVGDLMSNNNSATTDLTDLLKTQLGTAFDTGGFDTTEMFKNADAVFNADLERQLARIREEMSGYGHGAGSTDRMDVLGRTASEALAKFGLGKQQIAMQAFEDAANRRLSGIGAGTNLTSVMEDASLGRGQLGAQLAQLLGNLDVAEGNQNIATAQTQSTMAAQLAEMLQVPFDQAMQIANNITNPALDRQLTAGQVALNNENAGIDRAISAQQQMLNNFLAQFNLGESGRQIADQDIMRRLAEFARTQGGRLGQVVQFMGSQPGLDTAVGPSSASQLGDLIGSAPWGAFLEYLKELA